VSSPALAVERRRNWCGVRMTLSLYASYQPHLPFAAELGKDFVDYVTDETSVSNAYPEANQLRLKAKMFRFFFQSQ
jgi:hypothetical protein